MTQRGPNVRVANLGTSDPVEQLAVHVPGNGLGLPGRRGAVPDDAPSMPRLIRMLPPRPLGSLQIPPG
jgi:hypothetical protein